MFSKHLLVPQYYNFKYIPYGKVLVFVNASHLYLANYTISKVNTIWFQIYMWSVIFCDYHNS